MIVGESLDFLVVHETNFMWELFTCHQYKHRLKHVNHLTFVFEKDVFSKDTTECLD